MYGVTRVDRIRNNEPGNRENGLRWFGHAKRKNNEN